MQLGPEDWYEDEGKWDDPLGPDSYARIAEERYDDRYWDD
jgi:hypothetical protein